MTPLPHLNIAQTMPASCANGPGRRYCLWLQGCARGCPGCCNPEMQSVAAKDQIDPCQLADRISSEHAAIDGISVSGGEPLQQAEALLLFLQAIVEKMDPGILIFSGYQLEEIRSLEYGGAILALTDVLIAGPYQQELRVARGLRGSSNQQIHLLTSRHSMAEIEDTPEAEVILTADGRIVTSGIAEARLS